MFLVLNFLMLAFFDFDFYASGKFSALLILFLPLHIICYVQQLFHMLQFFAFKPCHGCNPATNVLQRKIICTFVSLIFDIKCRFICFFFLYLD